MRIEMISHPSGDQLPIHLDDDGLPIPATNEFILGRRALGTNTLTRNLRELAPIYQWQKRERIDLWLRITTAQGFTEAEIRGGLVEILRRDQSKKRKVEKLVVSPHSFNQRLTTVRQFIGHLFDLCISLMPTDDRRYDRVLGQKAIVMSWLGSSFINSPPENRGKKKGLTEEQMKFVVKVLDPEGDAVFGRDPAVRYRNYISIMIMLNYGLRPGELLRLLVQDIEFGAISAILVTRRLGTSKVQPLSDELVQSHKGDIDAVWNDWVKLGGCQPAGDRSGYEYDACVIPFDSSSAGSLTATERTIIDGFKRVCEASSASTFVIDQDGGKYLECTDSTTSGSFASVKTRPDRSGLFVYMKTSRRSAEHASIRQEQQAAQEKADDEYRYKLLANPSALGFDSLVRLISRFKDNDPKNLIPAAQKRLDELNAVADRQAKLAQERTAKRAAEVRSKQEHRSAGDQVCHLGSDVSVQRPTGILIFGRPEYRTVTGTVQVVAYVEGVSGSKLQLRISGLNFNGDGQTETLNQLDNYNGSSLRVNNIIWDSAYNWRDCP